MATLDPRIVAVIDRNNERSKSSYYVCLNRLDEQRRWEIGRLRTSCDDVTNGFAVAKEGVL